MTEDKTPKGLAELVHNCRVPVVIANTAFADSPLTIVNAAFSEMTGYQADQIIGKNCRFMQPPSGVGPVRGRMRAFLTDDTAKRGQFVIPNARKDGSRFLNLLLLTKLKHPDHPSLIMGSQFDITSRPTAELATYSASLTYDMRLIAKLVKDSGWSMPPADKAVTDSLERIAEFAL
ncbi:MAG: PAS domain-containing protein [Pseudomonadota bacterium]